MERILPVGSVVEIQGKKVMLLGAALKEHEGKLVRGYYAVRYPRGFVTIDSLGFAPADAIGEVCALGFEDAVGTKYIDGVTQLYGELEGKSPEEANRLMAEAGEELKAMVEKQRSERQDKKLRRREVNMEQLLALGTVVRVQLAENSTMRFVIAGYFPHDKKTDKIYDYSAVLYPCGMQLSPAIQMFNYGQIVAVEHPGYLDDDGRDFTKKLPEAFEQYAKEVGKLIRQAQETEEVQPTVNEPVSPAPAQTATENFLEDLAEADRSNAMAYRIEAAAGCNIGRRRTNNEDNFYFDNRMLPKENAGIRAAVGMETELEREQIFGVFDGMGGESYGEEAFFLAADTARNTEKLLADFIYPPKQYLTDLIQKMNQAVCDRSEELGSGRMGSTAVLLYVNSEYAYVCNVGDSRAFRLRQGELLQISEDHTDARFLTQQGITGRKPSLTQHLGIWPEEMVLEPYVAKGELADGDQYLLCSDGLTDMVTNADICAILKEAPDVRHCVDALIAKALENGGRDNVTVIVVRVKEDK